MEVNQGDVIRIESNKVGVPPRRGTVTSVLQDDPPRIEVDWDDGHTSILDPFGGNVRVEEGRGA